MSKVSMIIPCYNMEKYLDKCIGSILNQSFKDIQLIIVDDGSTDRSEQLILERTENINSSLSDFVYIKQENQGVGAACNTGFKAVTGDYLILLDCDDWLEPDSIKLQSEFLDNHSDYALVRTNGWTINEQTNRKTVFCENGNHCEGDIFEILLKAETYNWPGTYMMRMSVLDRIYPDREIYATRAGQNLQFLMAAAYKNKAGYIDVPLMNYLERSDSLSHFSTNSATKKLEAMITYKDVREKMIDLLIPKSEQNYYYSMLNIRFARILLSLAAEANDRKCLEKQYSIINKIDKPSLEDKVIYYGCTNKYIAKFYRAIEKAQRIIRKG